MILPRIILSTLLLLLVSCGSGEEQALSPPSVTLVESVPLETVLGMDEIPDTRPVWMEMIRDAKSTLDIAQFYIANREGEGLEDVIREVLAAAQRGVQVRVLVEKKFYQIYPETVDRLGSHAGIQTHIYDLSGHNGTGVHHAKYFIVDNRKVFLGSQNWDWRALAHINELGVAISDIPVASAFSHAFAFDWLLAEQRSIEEVSRTTGSIATDFPVVIVDSLGRHEITPVFSPRDLLPMGATWDETAIKRMIDDARDSLKLQVLSYRSYPSLEDALLKAAARGVQVSILVSDWSLYPEQQADLKRLQQTENIIVRISRIPVYSGGFISFARVEHCKYLLADAEWAWIGTSNWSRDYFHSSRNVGVILHSPSLTRLLHEKYMQSWDGPYTEVVDPSRDYPPRIRDDGSGT
jgi:phosphatidylserine/phosphatidylglycerophosphate/cardiolipin synthase-like enzyme